MDKITDKQKILTGITCLLLALALITLGCGATWGVTGACIGGGIVLAIYGFVSLYKVSSE